MFPKSTEFNKKIPKTKFYEHIELGRKIKDSFVKDIDSIIWANKIAPSTVNIAAGEKVTEIQVFRIILKQRLRWTATTIPHGRSPKSWSLPLRV